MSANTSAAAPAKSKKMLVIIIAVVVVVLVIGGGAAAWFLSNRSHADEEEGGAPAAARKEAPKVAPTFLPMENMVVNLADPGGDRFAQIGVTLELEDVKTSDQVKLYLPTIRSGILLLVSQRTSSELLSRDGKEKLAADIRREVSRPLGYAVPKERARAAEAEQEGDGEAEDRPARKRSERNPVLRVLFSNFIIQ